MNSKTPTSSTRRSSVKKPAQSPETVEVPRLSSPFSKAPTVDPYLQPGYTSETLSFGGVQLPPILRGIQPGLGLNGQPIDYRVTVTWVSRRQIDWVLSELERQHPEIEQVLHIVSRWMCTLDTIRDEAKFGIGAGMSWLKDDKPDIPKALEQLQGVVEMLGRWHDEHRLHLR